jgi:hypothetical protein
MTDTAYQKNTREQYEALGRFVEAFEAMVHEARTCCLDLLQSGLSRQQKKLVEIPLCYHALGAKAVFEIFRAVFYETISDMDYRTKYGLRVCPKTSGRITKFSEHEAD